MLNSRNGQGLSRNKDSGVMDMEDKSEWVSCGCGWWGWLWNLSEDGHCPKCRYSDDLVERKLKKLRRGDALSALDGK
jgi:hypothetical protein